jgi:ferredoxin
MTNKIYYFTGRGNSLITAQALSKRLDSPRLIPIRHGVRHDAAEDVDSIGIFTPVIDIGIPAYVLKFIDHLQVKNKKTYVYAVVTNGGMPGAAMEQIRKHLKKNNLTLSAEFLMKFGIGWTASSEWLQQIDLMSVIIRHKQKKRIPPSVKDRLLTMANPLAKRIIPNEDKKFALNSSCNGCGICERICPVKNIQLRDSRPVWLHSCEQCAACFSWCPSEAITGTNLAARTRYRNSDITLDQMLYQPEA